MKNRDGLSPVPEAVAGQGGFSMVEVLVSSVITAVVATSAFYFLSSQNSMGIRGNDAMKGVNYGKLKMDSLKVVPYADLVSGSDTVSERYIRSWHVTLMRNEASVPNGRKKIELNVIWPMSGENAVSFTSIKSDDRFKENGP